MAAEALDVEGKDVDDEEDVDDEDIGEALDDAPVAAADGGGEKTSSL